MSKKLIIVIIIVVSVLIVLAAGGYVYLKYFKKSGNIFKNIGDITQKLINDATKGVLPSISTNPLENKPDINPSDAGNPIKNIKTNPFE